MSADSIGIADHADFFAAVASRLRHNAAALCLTPDNAVAAHIKAAGNGMLPCPVVSLSGLMTAAAALTDAPIRQIIQAAAIGGGAGGEVSDDSLSWRLYEHLRRDIAVADVARYHLARKLAALFEEIDDYFPVTEATPRLAALAAADQQHESIVAAAAWEALLAADDDPLLCRKNRLLQALAEKMVMPVVAIVNDETTPTEERFYRRCRADIITVPAVADDSWFDRVAVAPQCAQASAPTLQETARLALAAIRRHAVADAGDIGVVVYDRLLARRLRAVAEAEGVLIKDSVGWRAETLTIGAALATFVRVALGEFALPDFFTLLQPPLYAANTISADDAINALAQTTNRRPTTMEELEKVLQARGNTQPAAAVCVQLMKSRRRAPPKASPAEWMRWLQTEAATAMAAWRHDNIAAHLISRLQAVADNNKSMLNGEEFLMWLNGRLETETGGDEDIQSRIEFVSPTTARRFSALVLLGCGGENNGGDDGWLGDSVRRQLGLPDRLARLKQQRRRFMRLIVAHEQISAVWQNCGDNGEQRRPYPLWRLLAQRAQRDGNLLTLAAPCDNRRAALTPPPPAIAYLRSWPSSLPLTAADRLMTCPYLFYINDLLRLRDKELSADEELSPAHIGTLVHHLLKQFSDATAGVDDKTAWREEWRRLIEQETLRGRLSLRIYGTFWREGCADSLMEWEKFRRQQGWKTEDSEFSLKAEWRGRAQTVVLKGRVDRLDGDENGKKALIDYKSGALPRKKNMENGEAPQLSLYAYLYTRLHGGTVMEQTICNPVNYGGVKQLTIDSPRLPRPVARLRAVLRQIDQQAPLPANGVPDDCANCPAAGVCRRDHWQATSA